MSTAPYGVRLLVGAAATALEETIRLPHTILTYPMTLASQLAQLVMKMQQDLAELVNKGDETLEQWFPPKDEQPEWATFDEDLLEPGATDPGAADTEQPDGARLTEGRFALYSTGAVEAPKPSTNGAAANGASVATPAIEPAIVADLDYAELTLAQLRARLPQLKVDDLEALLTYENNTKSRAPFQTLLANRITRATAK
ncbi:lipid droplet-associated protein [Mycolicibacterium mucogenicum]|uniref:lipid droplet-associated protein n=1 Tax=Mycolicibacterium mucogenicum TaxID=56689 RepID=UPI00226A97B6|nr:lipid droplet-associated protein [Mycolicibacterium mucogenicum]MCX8559568.1 lipid droplet-associated protein [Mycolicibacterium mucogenicum]